MNTKNTPYFIVLMLMLFVIIISCKDDIENDNTSISADELPQDAITFLDRYFPNIKIINANKDHDGKYSSLLGEQLGDKFGELFIVVFFDEKGEWLRVDAPNGLSETGKEIILEKLPNSVSVRDEFNSYYGDYKITNLIKEKYDEICFVLDHNYYSLIIDTHEGWTHADIYTEGRYEVPEDILFFIQFNLRPPTKGTPEINSRLLRFKGSRGYIYRFIDIYRTYIDFYEDGEWFHIKNKDNNKIYQYIVDVLLPKSIYATLKDNFEGVEGNINTISRFNNGSLYGVQYQDNKFVLISKDNEVIEIPLDKAKAYIENGFYLDKELDYEVRPNTGGAYHLRHTFMATGKEISISLVTDYEGGMRSISAGPITSEKEKVVPLPKAVLSTMPNAAIDYVREYYDDDNIIQISYNYSKSQDDVSDKFCLTVSVPNNLIFIYFEAITGEFLEEYKAIGESK